MKIRAVGADLDGTLLAASNTLTPFAARTIEDILATGTLFFPITGKTMSLTQRILDGFNLPDLSMVCLDGALVVAKGQELWDPNSFVRITTARSIMAAAGDIPLFAVDGDMLYTKGTVREDQYRHWACMLGGSLSACAFERLTVLVFLSQDVRELETLKNHILTIDRSLLAVLTPSEHPGEYTLIVFTAKRTKYHGTERLLRLYGLVPQDLLFLGDWKNDIPLFEHAGFPVAMRNADPDLKQRARACTLYTNEQDGATRFLRGFFNLDSRSQ